MEWSTLQVLIAGSCRKYYQHQFYAKMNLIGNIDQEAKQRLVDRNPNSWYKAFFKMEKGCRAYENVYPSGDNHYGVRKGDDSFGVNIENRTCTCNWWTLSGAPCVHTIVAYCFIKSDPALGKTCKNEPQLKPTKEKKKPGRKKIGSSLVYPSHEVGDAESTVGGSTADVDESGPIGVDESGINKERKKKKRERTSKVRLKRELVD
ncbi:60S ribosomal protein L34 [Tanacetum coccineum]